MSATKRESVADKLLNRLVKLGVTKRKAAILAPKLAPVAAKAPVTGTVTGKLEAKLIKLGLTQRKATALAQKLAPTVRAAIKAKAAKQRQKLADVDDALVENVVDEETDAVEDPELDKVAPRVNGHRVRLDLPVVRRHFWQSAPLKNVELLRVIDGLSTTATYLVAAVRGESSMVAVRQLGLNLYNVKFYPTMAAWDRTQDDLRKVGATDYLAREWYQRMHCSQDTLYQILYQIEQENKPKNTPLLRRLLSVSSRSLIKAFDYLHKRVSVAA